MRFRKKAREAKGSMLRLHTHTSVKRAPSDQLEHAP